MCIPHRRRGSHVALGCIFIFRSKGDHSSNGHCLFLRTRSVTIAYAKKKSGEESVLAELADKTVRMWRLIDRSEEMYMSAHGDGGSYRWRIGHEFGALTWLGPEADAKEKVLFDQCRPVSNR